MPEIVKLSPLEKAGVLRNVKKVGWLCEISVGAREETPTDASYEMLHLYSLHSVKLITT
jgi:hypothetical protein